MTVKFIETFTHSNLTLILKLRFPSNQSVLLQFFLLKFSRYQNSRVRLIGFRKALKARFVTELLCLESLWEGDANAGPTARTVSLGAILGFPSPTVLAKQDLGAQDWAVYESVGLLLAWPPSGLRGG